MREATRCGSALQKLFQAAHTRFRDPCSCPRVWPPKVQSCGLPHVRRSKAEPAEQEARAAEGATVESQDNYGVLPLIPALPPPSLPLAPAALARHALPCAHKTFMTQLCHTCLHILWQIIRRMPRSLLTATFEASVLLQHVIVR